MATVQLITENIDLWTSAIKAKSTQGRGSSKKLELYGIKKLRELILDLAVRGKLAPQDPNDEPASVLLERIAVEKAQLVRDKKIQKQKALPDLTEEEIPFEIPEGWSFIRLGNLACKLGSGSTPRGGQNVYTDSGIPFLRSQNVWSDGLRLDDIVFIPNDTHKKMENTQVFPGDILLNITGASLGRSTIFPNSLAEANVSQHVTIIRLIEPQMNRFIHLGILSPMVQRLVWGRQVGMAIEGLSKKVLEQFEFPIPPLAEQQRIVAKVEELMVICDQLEEQTETSLDAHQLLIDTLLETLTTTEDANELCKNWARLSEHFDTLITTDYAIEQLKQTILQLAVMGKLVPQDPSDEPASERLKRIAAEKEQMIKDRKIKKQPPLPEITDEEKPFSLPKGWEWCRLDMPSLHSESGWSPKCHGFAREENAWGVLKVSAVTWGKFNPQENKRLPDNLEPRPELEVRENDFLISRANTAELVARSVVVPSVTEERLMMSDKIIRFVFSDHVSPHYFSLANNSRWSRDYYARVAGGTSSSMKNVSRHQIQMLVVALPPLEEQNRIISKVDRLMELCDQLQTRLNESQITQSHLADTVVYEIIGEPVKIIGATEVNTQAMRISTELSLTHEKFQDDAVIAPIILELGGLADAKDVWARTNLSLPDFYAQLKLEIDAQYIFKPATADFNKV